MFLSCLCSHVNLSRNSLYRSCFPYEIGCRIHSFGRSSVQIKKRVFWPSNFYVSNCHLDIPMEFWGLQSLQSWHSTLSQCFWVLANESRPAAYWACEHNGPKIPKRYLRGRFWHVSCKRSNQSRILKNNFLDLKNIILHLIHVLQGFVWHWNIFPKKILLSNRSLPGCLLENNFLKTLK